MRGCVTALNRAKMLYFEFKYTFTVVSGKEICKKINLYFRPISSFDPTAMPVKSTPKWSHFADFFI